MENDPRPFDLRTQSLISYNELYLNHPDSQIKSLAADITSLLKALIIENDPSVSSPTSSDTEYSFFQELVNFFTVRPT